MVALDAEYDWRELLNRCITSSRLNSSELRRVQFEVSRREIAIEAGAPYGRCPVLRSAQGEVLLLRWAEDIPCAVHDHGAARGVMLLLQGSFHERQWTQTDTGLLVRDSRSFSAPEQQLIPAGAIHDMRATHGGISVHCYWPALTQMNVFDFAERQTLTVSDDCGAWIPRDERMILRRTPWTAHDNLDRLHDHLS